MASDQAQQLYEDHNTQPLTPIAFEGADDSNAAGNGSDAARPDFGDMLSHLAELPRIAAAAAEAGARAGGFVGNPFFTLFEGETPRAGAESGEAGAEAASAATAAAAGEKIKVKLGEDAAAFRAADGSMLVYREPIPGSLGGLFYSPDGKNFYEMARTGFGGSGTDHLMTFTDPRTGKSYHVERKGDELKIGDQEFKKVDTPEEIEAFKMPEQRVNEYMYKLPDGRYLYVSSDKNGGYESFKAYIGKPGEMKEIEIKDIERYRDGGTTYIDTSEGKLFSPTFLEPEKQSTWNGQPIEEVAPGDFDVSEVNGQLTLKEKKK